MDNLDKFKWIYKLEKNDYYYSREKKQRQRQERMHRALIRDKYRSEALFDDRVLASN